MASNRFARTAPDVPVTVATAGNTLRQAIIDVLVPAYTSRVRQNVKISEDRGSCKPNCM